MTISASLVLLAVIWFLLLFVALPLNIQTQKEKGRTVAGTPSSAHENPQILRKIKIVSLVSVIIWIPLTFFIISGVLSISDLDFLNTLNSDS